MAPAQVSVENQEQVWRTLYARPQIQTKRISYAEGDTVRIAQAKKNFKKGYTPAWTEELFTISRVLRTNPVTYVLKDSAGDELRGGFYHEEIQKVGAKTVFRIEAILQERHGVGGRREYLVKWYGYPSSFNSWISDLVRYRA